MGDGDGKNDEDGGDDGGDGKFEYVTSNERGSSQVRCASRITTLLRCSRCRDFFTPIYILT